MPPDTTSALLPPTNCSSVRVTETFLSIDSLSLEGTADSAESFWSSKSYPKEDEKQVSRVNEATG